MKLSIKDATRTHHYLKPKLGGLTHRQSQNTLSIGETFSQSECCKDEWLPRLLAKGFEHV